MYQIKDLDGQTVFSASRWIDAVSLTDFALTDNFQIDQCTIYQGEITWRYKGNDIWANASTATARSSTWKEPSCN